MKQRNKALDISLFVTFGLLLLTIGYFFLFTHNHTQGIIGLSREIDEIRRNPTNQVEQMQGFLESQDFLGSIIVSTPDENFAGTIAIVNYHNKLYILTAGHCVPKLRLGESEENYSIYLFVRDDVIRCKPSNFIIDEKLDLASVRFPGSSQSDLLLSDAIKNSIGQKVIAYGHPKGDFLKTLGSIVDIQSGRICHNAKIFYGSSGGPLIKVVDGKRYLIGIHTVIQFDFLGKIENFQDVDQDSICNHLKTHYLQ